MTTERTPDPEHDPSSLAASYDATPYPRLAHRTTHPAHMASLAHLLGMEPAPPQRSRILELGCASGTNILPMALALPDSHFVGVDISPRQIARGRADVEALGLHNVELAAADLRTLLPAQGLDVGAPALQPFDYIIAHGLYSWVPEEVRDALLALCRALLAPQGVAYISYNVYPGWHALEGMRRMMIYHSRSAAELTERTEKARELLDLLVAAQPPDTSPNGALVAGFRNYIDSDLGDMVEDRSAYLLHDHLEQINQPVYFHQFAEQAEAHGLQYLCDAELPTDFAQGLPEGVDDQIAGYATNLVELQQYQDFARYRMFRRTLLCHEEVTLTRSLRADALRRLWIASPAVPESNEPALRPVSIERFRTQKGVSIAMDHPLSKAAFLALVRAWPDMLTLDELVRAAVALLRGEEANGASAEVTPMPALGDEDIRHVAVNLLRAVSSNEQLLELSAMPQVHVTLPSERPLASPWARHEIAWGTAAVTNLRHERIRLEPLEVEVLRLLDGSRDVAALCDALGPAVRAGEIPITHEGLSVQDPDAASVLLEKAVAARLRSLGRAALLIA